jgi:hypothetical protein
MTSVIHSNCLAEHDFSEKLVSTPGLKSGTGFFRMMLQREWAKGSPISSKLIDHFVTAITFPRTTNEYRLSNAEGVPHDQTLQVDGSGGDRMCGNYLVRFRRDHRGVIASCRGNQQWGSRLERRHAARCFRVFVDRKEAAQRRRGIIVWCRVRDLNSRPTVYKTAALPLS